jgi:bisphosphoglycerate-dependent phosphoglycerate mutase
MDTEDKKEIDELVRNYEEMDETGKEKLKEVSEKILEIWNTVITPSVSQSFLMIGTPKNNTFMESINQRKEN